LRLLARAARRFTARTWRIVWHEISERVESSASAVWRAIGVLGTGVDICYPKENKKLYEKVLARGAILS
jgi:DNA recombination-mediator protein A